MSNVKKQHYVPQFYLKKFASETETLYAFDKVSRKSFRTTVRDAASGHRFYDIHPDIHNQFRATVVNGEKEDEEVGIIDNALDPQFIEHELGTREERFAPILNEVLDAIENGRRFTDKQRWNIAEFVSLQILRTPESRKVNIDLQKNLLTELLRRFSEFPNAYVEYDNRRASLEHAQMMFNPELQNHLSKTLLNHIWLIGENTTSQHFYISDAPVVKRSHIHSPFMGVGIGSFGVEVAFPLSPKYILIMCERTAFLSLGYSEENIISLTSDNITYYNSLQVLQSYRSIYCPVGDFLLAAEICNEHPESCMPDRVRIETT